MHVAEQIYIESFEIHVNDAPGTLEDVFEGWDTSDRFGIVVREPLAALGASLLIEVAIAAFYEADPLRRSARATYPEIYLFHVGGPHGDYSNFDFWPPRKEVMLPADQPVTLLEAINERGITRLAVPSRPTGDPAVLADGPSTWAEAASTMERLRSCLVYDSSGQVEDGQVRLSSSDPRTFENIHDTLVMATQIPEPGEFEDPQGQMAVDEGRWIEIVKARVAAEGPIDDDALSAQRAKLPVGTQTLTQTFRSVTTQDALGLLASHQ